MPQLLNEPARERSEELDQDWIGRDAFDPRQLGPDQPGRGYQIGWKESQPLEIIGELRPALHADLVHFNDRFSSHPWCLVPSALERLVVGNVPSMLEEWMPTERYAVWQQTNQHRHTVTAAMTFIARDGLHTAVVPPLPEPGDFLMLATHELVETSLNARHEAEGHIWQDQTHTGLSHTLWTEYVVERTRSEIANELGLAPCTLHQSSMTDQLGDWLAELPSLLDWAVVNDAVPTAIFQHWYELGHIFAMAMGRADGGIAASRADLDRAVAMEWISSAGEQWNLLTGSLRRVFEQPALSANEHDIAVRRDGWLPLYDASGDEWNRRYEDLVTTTFG